MRASQRRSAPWLLGWAALALAGALALVRIDIAQRREAFQADARIAHRLLSQRAAQHDAILATLALLSPSPDSAERSERRLVALYPQLLAVLRRDRGERWPDDALQGAEGHSRDARRAVLGPVDAADGRYMLMLHAEPSSYALRIDAQRMVPWDEWPLERGGPVQATLVHGNQAIVLQAGSPTGAQPAGLTSGFTFAKPLAAPSQPFELRLRRATGPAEWPWTGLLAWALSSALGLAALAAWQRGRHERRRAEALLRVERVERLNALGELAGGMAHELNQPLAAVLSGAQAAGRLLDDDPPALDTARQAMRQVAVQARRAADVVARLRRLIETPDAARTMQPVRLEAALRDAVDLLGPELRRRGIEVTLAGHAPPVNADPVALDQIVHNLLGNAMRALEDVPAGERRLALTVAREAQRGVLGVRDSGPGLAPEALARAFEPFYTTRRGGLGLGLSLCETLAQAMGGTLAAGNAEPRGAEFRLALALALAEAAS